MGSRREEERNEKIIRGLMKLPPNRRCINCNSLGPQYVCINFWTFVCMTCSGVHREFTHRVKSVSMAKFTSQEVEALQKGGNQRAREIYLKDWDPQRHRLPDNSNADKLRQFIKSVYVDKKYTDGKSPDKPPKDTQNLRGHEDETRRASSYHSYSQSPPYDFQYEERRYGKHAPALTRKPGSDRGLYEGKFSSFFSPSRLSDANEGSISRASDYSVSSGGDPSRSGALSPNFQKDVGSPLGQSSRDISSEDSGPYAMHTVSSKRDGGILHTQRSASLGSFASFESNSMSFKSGNPVSLVGVASDTEQPVENNRNNLSTLLALEQSSTSGNSDGLDLFNMPSSQQNVSSLPASKHVSQQPESSSPSLDLVQPSAVSAVSGLSSRQSSVSNPLPHLDLLSEMLHPQLDANSCDRPSDEVVPPKEGWATFDMPQQTVSVSTEKLDSAETSASVSSLDFFSEIPRKDTAEVSGDQSSNTVVTGDVGWAMFDSPPDGAPGSTGHNATAIIPSAASTLGNVDQLFHPMQWPSFQDATAFAPSSSAPNLFQEAPQNIGVNSDQTTTRFWSAFENSAYHVSAKNLQNSSAQLPMHNHLVVDQHLSSFKSEDLDNTGIQGGPAAGAGPYFSSLSPYLSIPSQSLPMIPETEEAHAHATNHKSTNPFDFDLPYSSDVESSDASQFWDMSSLQAVLPNGEVSTSFVGGVTQPWFHQNPMTSHVPAGGQGTLGFMAAQSTNPQITNVPAQGPVLPIGGNPFA